jgi:hypothetical protein
MASAFVTAIFLTFLSMASAGPDGASSRPRGPALEGLRGEIPRALCYAALVLFYVVFLSGMYVNLFVAGPVFSLPLNSELAAFVSAEHTAPFLIHEAAGAILLLTLILLTLSLWTTGERRLSLVGSVSALLVAYSAYVGSLNLTSPLAPVSSPAVPMLSAAALISAIVITMLLTLKMKAGSGNL